MFGVIQILYETEPIYRGGLTRYRLRGHHVLVIRLELAIRGGAQGFRSPGSEHSAESICFSIDEGGLLRLYPRIEHGALHQPDGQAEHRQHGSGGEGGSQVQLIHGSFSGIAFAMVRFSAGEKAIGGSFRGVCGERIGRFHGPIR